MFLFLFELRLYADGAVNLLLRFGTQMPVCQQYIAGYTVAIFWHYPIKCRVTKASALEFCFQVITTAKIMEPGQVWSDSKLFDMLMVF